MKERGAGTISHCTDSECHSAFREQLLQTIDLRLATETGHRTARSNAGLATSVLVESLRNSFMSSGFTGTCKNQ